MADKISLLPLFIITYEKEWNKLPSLERDVITEMMQEIENLETITNREVAIAIVVLAKNFLSLAQLTGHMLGQIGFLADPKGNLRRKK